MLFDFMVDSDMNLLKLFFAPLTNFQMMFKMEFHFVSISSNYAALAISHHVDWVFNASVFTIFHDFTVFVVIRIILCFLNVLTKLSVYTHGFIEVKVLTFTLVFHVDCVAVFHFYYCRLGCCLLLITCLLLLIRLYFL